MLYPCFREASIALPNCSLPGSFKYAWNALMFTKMRVTEHRGMLFRMKHTSHLNGSASTGSHSQTTHPSHPNYSALAAKLTASANFPLVFYRQGIKPLQQPF